MRWTTPTDDQYDERRALFNAMIDGRPRLIATCGSPADVVAALSRATSDDLEIAVRAGGHSVAGTSTVDDGLVIDVRGMKAIDIDPTARTARVGAGVTWGEFDAAAQEHGLATTGGRVSTTGVAGFTLGGGSGWLERKHGLACDNLIAVDLVTADGARSRASETTRTPTCSGRCTAAAATSAWPPASSSGCTQSGPMVHGRADAWHGRGGGDVGRAYRDWATDAPDELGSALVCSPDRPRSSCPPHLQGKQLVGLARLWCGTTRGRRGGGADARAAARGRPGRPDAVRRAAEDDRRPAGLPELLERRLPRRVRREGARRLPGVAAQTCRRRSPADPLPVGRRGGAAGRRTRRWPQRDAHGSATRSRCGRTRPTTSG